MGHIYTALLREVEQKNDFWLNKKHFLGEEESKPYPPPWTLILNNLSIVMVENKLQQRFGFSFCPFCKDTPHPADSVQLQGCCCLPSYQVQEGISTLANWELLRRPVQSMLSWHYSKPWQYSKCLYQQWGNKNFSPKSTLVKGVVRQPSQAAGPFLLMDCLLQVKMNLCTVQLPPMLFLYSLVQFFSYVWLSNKFSPFRQTLLAIFFSTEFSVFDAIFCSLPQIFCSLLPSVHFPYI